MRMSIESSQHVTASAEISWEPNLVLHYGISPDSYDYKIKKLVNAICGFSWSKLAHFKIILFLAKRHKNSIKHWPACDFWNCKENSWDRGYFQIPNWWKIITFRLLLNSLSLEFNVGVSKRNQETKDTNNKRKHKDLGWTVYELIDWIVFSYKSCVLLRHF